MGLTDKMRERVLRNDTIRAWISKRAYELHQLGGYEHGRAIDDWRIAESELLALASLFEEIIRSKSKPKQAINKRRDGKTTSKGQRGRTRSASASPSEAPPMTEKQEERSQEKSNQESTKKKKTR